MGMSNGPKIVSRGSAATTTTAADDAEGVVTGTTSTALTTYCGVLRVCAKDCSVCRVMTLVVVHPVGPLRKVRQHLCKITSVAGGRGSFIPFFNLL